jgi:hypothetical protein
MLQTVHFCRQLRVSEEKLEKENPRKPVYQINGTKGRIFSLKSCEIFKILETVLCIPCVHEANVDGIELRLRVGELRNKGLIPSRIKKQSLLHGVKTDSRAHEVSCTIGNGSTSSREKTADDNSFLSSVEVKNEWNYISTSHTSS